MSLVGWWRFENNLDDSSGYGNDGSGSPTYVSGKIGQGIEGDGSNIEIPLSDSLEKAFTGEQMTLSVWWKQDSHTDSEQWMDIINTGGFRLERGPAGNSSNADYWCNFGAGSSDHQNEGINLSSGNIGVNSGEWFHVVVRRKGSDLEVWINGELDQSGTTDIPMSYSNDLILNEQDSGSQIDDIRVYDHALSVKEINRLSRAKVLHYKFDSPDYIGDSSGYGNAGTNNGATFSTNSMIGSGSYSFDGSSSNISVDASSDTSLDFSGDITYSFWLYHNSPIDTDSNNNYRVALSYGGSNSSSVIIEENQEINGSVNLASSGRSSIRAGSIDLDSGNHICMTYDSSTNEMKIYKNGVEQGSGTLPDEERQKADNTFHISDSSKAVNGRIDDVRVYAEALSASEIKEIYKQKASIDDKGNLHTHRLEEGKVENFKSGNFNSNWTTSNAYIKTDTSFTGNYSMGSSDQGSIDAVWKPPILSGGTQIDSFEYYWWETTNQTGHQVRLIDSNGNKVQQSETENPEWQVSQGDGSMNTVRGYDGQSYQNWTLFRFEFDWDNGNYTYFMKDRNTGEVRTGTESLINNTDVAEIQFVGSDGTNCRFDRIKINGEEITEKGIKNSSKFNEVGPGADSFVGYWPLDGDTRDYSGNSNHGINNGASVTSGLGQNAYRFNGTDDYIDLSTISSTINIPSMTVSFWAKHDSSSWALGNGGQFRVKMRSSDIEFWIREKNGGSSNSIFGGNISAGNWYFVCCTYDGTIQRIYLDGSEVQSANPGLNNLDGGSRNLTIGESYKGSGNHFNGKIQDVRIFDRALTEEEIKNLYNLTDPRRDQRVIQSDTGEVFTKGEFSELL